jgi:hypothetical protein
MSAPKEAFRNASGQILLATLLFCFIFTALFACLYHSGTAYRMREQARRGGDLTAVSSGAVYANGLQLVRASNVLAMLSLSFDLSVMASAISPFVPAFPLSVPAAVAAAKKADPRTRDTVHRAQAILFGIDLPPESPIGIYPALIFWEGRKTAGKNMLKSDFLNPLFFFNFESSRRGKNAVIPDMALRFRTADELIPSEEPPLYSLNHNGTVHFFTEDQVEPAGNPRQPDERRVRRDLPSDYAGMWVRRAGNNGGGEINHLSALGTGVLTALRDLLKDIRVDVTHRDLPANHSIVLQVPGKISGKGVDFAQISEAVLGGGALAAWNISDPPFQVHLQKIEISDLAGFSRIPFPGGGSSMPWIPDGSP